MMTTIATDLDGSFGKHPEGEPTLCISGRTFAEYNETCHEVAAKMPLYIRGVGAYGDRTHAAQFKASMIGVLKVDVYYEDDTFQAEIIKSHCPKCKVVLV